MYNNCFSYIFRYIICCRQKLNEEFQKQANTVIQQWEADVEKGREQEEKFQVLHMNVFGFCNLCENKL